MSTHKGANNDEMLRGRATLFQHLYSCFDGIAIRCAIELRIADVIHNHDGPISLSELARRIDSPKLNIDGLSRLMTFLVHKKVFDQVRILDHEEAVYTLNDCSKGLLHDSKTTIVPLFMMVTDSHLLSKFSTLSKLILEGGTSMMNTFGQEIWDFNSLNPQYNKLFNEAMACRTMITMDVVMSHYKFDGFKGTLVDVAGGIGTAIKEIVIAYPHIKGVNFDLPHVISTAPTYERVTHVEGDMFKTIPSADSILLKSVLHDWNDEECVLILKNCRKATSQRNGKIIIIDIILTPGGDDMFDDTRMTHDLVMLSMFQSGKERSQLQWNKLLEKAGFSHYNIIKIPALESIIEAYTD